MEERIADVLRRYPTKRAALLPVLWLCQERYGWISPGVMRAVAERLGESPAFVEGVVSFYTMYYTQPPARYVLQVCTTLSCAMCGGRELVDFLDWEFLAADATGDRNVKTLLRRIGTRGVPQTLAERCQQRVAGLRRLRRRHLQLVRRRDDQ